MVAFDLEASTEGEVSNAARAPLRLEAVYTNYQIQTEVMKLLSVAKC